MTEDEKIREVREEEERRGRRPIDKEAKLRRQRERKLILEAARRGDEGLFDRIIRENFGFEPGTQQYEAVWRLFRALRGKV